MYVIWNHTSWIICFALIPILIVLIIVLVSLRRRANLRNDERIGHTVYTIPRSSITSNYPVTIPSTSINMDQGKYI
uniref:Uncharacterized protein n=1 Tax=Acrobeloides nanus TaxID=290746 RepID=A0A914E2V6_9BILA